jgi:hypothetical protein
MTPPYDELMSILRLLVLLLFRYFMHLRKLSSAWHDACSSSSHRRKPWFD